MSELSAASYLFHDIALISVTFNSEKVIADFASTARYFSHVFIIDNSSSDESIAAIKSHIPHAVLIESSNNLGFSAANDIGLNLAHQKKIPFSLFINPDCTIDIASVQILHATLLAHPRAALASPRMLDACGKSQAARRWDYTQPYAAFAPQPLVDADFDQDIAQQVCIDGACFLTDTAKFMQAGGFSKELFLFFEEDDISLRLARCGFDLLYHRQATATHIGGGSTPPSSRVSLRKAYNYRWSRLYLTDAHIHRSQRILEAAKLLILGPIAVLAYALLFQKQKMLRWLGWTLAGWDGLFLTKFFRKFI